MTRRIVAIGGGGFLMERRPSKIDAFFVGAARVRRPRICFVSTGGGDPEEALAKYYKAFSTFDCRLSHLAFFRKPRPGAIPSMTLNRAFLRRTRYMSAAEILAACLPCGASGVSTGYCARHGMQEFC